MSSRLLTDKQILTLLAATPSRITALTIGLATDQLHTAPSPGEWSANDVLAHLRSCADVWGNCMETIIAQDRPTLRAVNPTTWIRQTDYPAQKFWVSLEAFTKQRTDLLAMLKPLASEDWSRTATVTGAGAPLERTVQSFAQRLAIHERTHLKQIERMVKSIPKLQ